MDKKKCQDKLIRKKRLRVILKAFRQIKLVRFKTWVSVKLLLFLSWSYYLNFKLIIKLVVSLKVATSAIRNSGILSFIFKMLEL